MARVQMIIGDKMFEIENAHTIQIHECRDPGCIQPHLILVGDSGEPFAQAILADHTLAKLFEFTVNRRRRH